MIAETTDLPTRFAKIVVTDDRGEKCVSREARAYLRAVPPGADRRRVPWEEMTGAGDMPIRLRGERNSRDIGNKRRYNMGHVTRAGKPLGYIRRRQP